ncbi:inter-alpha-trypsin inhibitor heavy chain-related [Zea mays]|uniref:Inter-alpha-trypsin inhibitor heavy chain-related n=1 Tax=Zea mays TaxID=4577 RepID=A0A1D6F1B3_MAIZE|nr:inter-alpha-trypsin inhibitor heavy chain-related [Zea mays]
MEDFARAVEDGLKLSKRLVLPGGVPPPRPPAGMERTMSSASASGPDPRLLPTAPMAYAVVTDPAAIDTPDVPSYQPYVYGHLDPPALIPLQMKEVDLAVDCALDAAHVTLRARWWLHCITRSRDCDVRLVVPLGEQEQRQLSPAITVALIHLVSSCWQHHMYTLPRYVLWSPGALHLMTGSAISRFADFLLVSSLKVEGGADICATFRWSQKLLYDSGCFSVDIPFHFPYFVNPLPKVFMKREKVQLTANTGFSKEVFLQGTSHPLKEKSRQGDKLFFLHEAIVENWSSKVFNFSYSVYSGDLSGGVFVQPSILCDYDDRDSFCIFLLPGSGNRKVFRKAVVFVVDTSGSMQGKPLENVKHAVSTALSELVQGDYFNIITFNDELHSFSSCLEQVNDKAIASATDWMNANLVAEGGTDIMHPLSEAMALLSSVHDTLPQIYLITDGSVDDEHNICQTTKTEVTNRGSKSPRISTFGLGSYCNHYFLRMLASVGKGHYNAALETASIENQIVKWFRRASSTIVENISIDAMTHLDEFEVDSEYIPDLSANSPLCVSGKYRGKFPDTVKAKGYLADMKEVLIELKVQQLKEVTLDKVIKLSIQNGVPSEYTDMVLLQTNLDNTGTQKVKQKLKGQKGRDEQQIPLHGLKLGFGNN